MFADFSNFMYKHNIPATAASFSIGQASADMAITMSQDIVIPALLAGIGLFRKMKSPPAIKFGPFARTIVSWVCVMATTYILMEYMFARCIMGLSTAVLNDADEKSMCKAREEVERPVREAKKAMKSAVEGIVGASTSDSSYANFSSLDNGEPQASSTLANVSGAKRMGADGMIASNTAPAQFEDAGR